MSLAIESGGAGPDRSSARPVRSDEELPEVLYTPDSSLRHPIVMLRAMFADLGRSRELAWRLFVRDTKAGYRQSMLGYFWVIGPPIASTLLFVFLHSQRILNIGATDVPYAVYVLTGLVLWQTFSASLTTPMARVGAAKKMLGKLNFPREALLLSGVYHVVFNLSIKLVLLAGVYAFFGVMPAWTVVFAPLGIFALIVLGLTIGLLLVPFAMLYQDVNRALGMAMNAWMLLTPVVYPPPTGWPASAVNWLNPVSPLLATTRQLATTGSVSQGWAFAAVLAASMLLLLAGWALYRLAMPHLVARMSA